MGQFKIHVFWLCFVFFNLCSSQKFNFTDSITFNQQPDDFIGQEKKWTVEGDVYLSNEDLLMFKSKVSIQTCHEVCTVDLTSCQGEKHASSNSCFCSLKSGNDHRLYLSSKFKIAQSGAKLTAVIPSHDVFGPVTGTHVIGTLPVVSYSNVKVEAMYQVDNGKFQKLLPAQTISMCSDNYVPIKVCVERKPYLGRIKIQLDDQTMSGNGRCVTMVEQYNFDAVSTHKLTFSYEHVDSIVYPELFTIQIVENKQSCSLPTTKQTTTITEETKNADTSSLCPKKKDAEFHDVLNTGSRDWRLAFRGTPYIEKSVWDSYLNKQVISVEPGCREVFSNATCTNHYRNNDALDNWSDINQVAFVVFKENKTVGHVVFNAVGSDFKTWFSNSRIVESSWVDMKNSRDNIFSINDHNGGQFVMLRDIRQNSFFGGVDCASSSGWFEALDTHKGHFHCPAETRGSSKIPKFIYAKNNVILNWDEGESDSADYIAIFLRYF